MRRSAGRPVVVGTALALVLLLAAAPAPGAALEALRRTGAAQDPTGPVVALVALCAWLLAGWLALTALCTLLARLPGVAGRGGAVLARRVAPAAARRAIEVGLGLAVTAGAIGAGSASAAGAPPASEPAAAAVPDGASSRPLWLDWGGTGNPPDLDWPAPPEVPPPASATSGPAPVDAPPPASATTSPGPVDAPSADPATSAPAPADAPPTGHAVPGPADVRAAPVPAADVPAADVVGGQVVVRPGDSLWRLAAQDLERRQGAEPSAAETAAAWPTWWAANRDVIGPDPDLIRPGTALRPPDPLGPDPHRSPDA